MAALEGDLAIELPALLEHLPGPGILLALGEQTGVGHLGLEQLFGPPLLSRLRKAALLLRERPLRLGELPLLLGGLRLCFGKPLLPPRIHASDRGQHHDQAERSRKIPQPPRKLRLLIGTFLLLLSPADVLIRPFLLLLRSPLGLAAPLRSRAPVDASPPRGLRP